MAPGATTAASPPLARQPTWSAAHAATSQLGPAPMLRPLCGTPTVVGAAVATAAAAIACRALARGGQQRRRSNWPLLLAAKRSSSGRAVAIASRLTVKECEEVRAPVLREDVRTVFRFVVPACGTAMLGPSLDAICAAIVGQFASIIDLAALGPTSAGCSIFFLLFTALGATVINSLAKARGRGDFEGARNTLSDACCLAVCCGLTVGTSVVVFCNTLLSVLVSPAALAAISIPAAAYMKIRAMAFPVQLLQLVFSAACLSALQDTVTPLRASAFGGVTGVVVSAVLIAGCKLGCVGAAVGTVAGQLVAVAVLAGRLRRSLSFDHTGADPTAVGQPLLSSPFVWLSSLRRHRMMPMLVTAAPFVTFQLMKVLLMGFETRMGSAFGPMSLGAHQIMDSIWRFLIIIGDPIMQAAQALVPMHFVAGTLQGRLRAQSLGNATLCVAATLGLLSGAAALFMGRTLPFCFTSNLGVAREAVGLTVPMVASVIALSGWHCNEGLMLATGRARLLAGLYAWNVFYFTTATRFVLNHGLTLFHSWSVFASMHTIFTIIVNVVLRMPGGILSPDFAKDRQK